MLKAILFYMDDTLLDWSKRTEDWQEFNRQHLEQVFNYIAREIHPLRTADAFYETAHSLGQQAWMQAENDLRAPSLGQILTRALEQVGVPPELLNVEAILKAYDWQPVGGVEA